MMVVSPSCHGENDPDPKSGQDLDPVKRVYCTSCWIYATNPTFSPSFFVVFVPDSMTFAANPRVTKLVSGSVPVEHAYKLNFV